MSYRRLRDRNLSAYEQWGLSFAETARNEFRGSEVERRARAGAWRFAAGAGRDGAMSSSRAARPGRSRPAIS